MIFLLLNFFRNRFAEIQEQHRFQNFPLSSFHTVQYCFRPSAVAARDWIMGVFQRLPTKIL